MKRILKNITAFGFAAGILASFILARFSILESAVKERIVISIFSFSMLTLIFSIALPGKSSELEDQEKIDS